MTYVRTSRISALLAVLFAFAVPAQAAERDIYPSSDLATAAETHKRVLLDFGGNWCTDCHVLDLYFHDSANKPLLDANYVLVHINIGRMNANVDIAEHYQIPLRKGVPALAVLGEHGELLYSQKTGEFEGMRRMQSSSVTDFLTYWKAQSAASTS
jgi:thiol:disulfide interchange protein